MMPDLVPWEGNLLPRRFLCAAGIIWVTIEKANTPHPPSSDQQLGGGSGDKKSLSDCSIQ